MKIITEHGVRSICEGVSMLGMVTTGMILQQKRVVNLASLSDDEEKIIGAEGVFDLSTMKWSLYLGKKKIAMLDFIKKTNLSTEEQDIWMIYSHLFEGPQHMLELKNFFEYSPKKMQYVHREDVKHLKKIVDEELLFSDEYRKGIAIFLKNKMLKEIDLKDASKETIAGMGMAMGILSRDEDSFMKMLARIQLDKSQNVPLEKNKYGF